MSNNPSESEPPSRKRRWFQFSLRSLLIFTTVCAIPCAWLGRKIEQKRKELKGVETLVKSGGRVIYDYQADSSNRWIPNAQPPGPDLLKWLLGDNFFTNVRDLGLVAMPVTDEGFETVKLLTKLQSLIVVNTKISDAGLKALDGLTQLTFLDLDKNNIGDAGLENLRGLTQLNSLDLVDTRVSDAGLANLKGISQLRYLNLRGTKVTRAGVNELQKSLPNCQILSDVVPKIPVDSTLDPSDSGRDLESPKGRTP